MGEISQQVFTACVLYLFYGMVLYIVDRRFKGFYRWCSGWVRKDPPPVEQGFIYNRGWRARTGAAVFWTTVQSVLVFLFGHPHPLVEILLWPLSIPLFVIGFYVGPWVYKIWAKREPILSKLDQIEQGKTSVGREIRGVTRSAAAEIRGALGGHESHPHMETHPAETSSNPPPEDPAPEQPDGRQMIREVLDRRRGRTGGQHERPKD